MRSMRPASARQSRCSRLKPLTQVNEIVKDLLDLSVQLPLGEAGNRIEFCNSLGLFTNGRSDARTLV